MDCDCWVEMLLLWQGGGEKKTNTKSSTMPPWGFHPENYFLTQGTQVRSYLKDKGRGSKFKMHFILICS